MVIQRTALERLWKDRCSVVIRDEVTDPVTKLTGFVEIVKIQDQPCKLSFETLTSTNGDGTAAVAQSVKVFFAPELDIPAGSKIIVTRPTGAVTEYAQSGQPGVFTNHQEIRLELFKRWA